MFIKYLETLYMPPGAGKKPEQVQAELRTMEQLLLTQLKASFEQTRRVEELIKGHVERSKASYFKAPAFFSSYRKATQN